MRSDPEPLNPPFTVPEKSVLAGWLEFHRAALLFTCEGPNDERRKRRPVPTSLMSPHGMVRHMADVEPNWFRWALDQPDASAIWTDAGEDAGWARWMTPTGRRTWQSGGPSVSKAG